MSYCCLCNKPITGVPALVAYPDNAPTFYYCESCASDIYSDACVGKMVRLHDEKMYNDLRENALCVIIAAAISND